MSVPMHITDRESELTPEKETLVGLYIVINRVNTEPVGRNYFPACIRIIHSSLLRDFPHSPVQYA